ERGVPRDLRARSPRARLHGGGGMRVHQPGSHLMRGGRAAVDDWSWARTKRRLRALYALARPYRARTLLATVSLLAATAVSLAPLVTDGVTSLVQNTLTLVGTALLLFFLDWRLALASLTVMPLMTVATAIFRKRSGRAYRSVRETLGLVTATLAEDIAGMRVLQSYTREGAAQENFHQVTDRYRASNMQT